MDARDDSTKEVAQSLMQRSSVQAVAKLTFVRIAYGAYGDFSGEVDIGEAREAAELYIKDDRTTISWNMERLYVPKGVAKLALGLLALTKDALPRGGEISIEASDLTGKVQFRVHGKAAKVIIPQGAEDALALRFADGIHARNVHLFHLIKLAQAIGVRIEPDLGDGSITFGTVPV